MIDGLIGEWKGGQNMVGAGDRGVRVRKGLVWRGDG